MLNLTNYSLSARSDDLGLKLVDSYWFIGRLIKSRPVWSVKLDWFFSVRMAELGSTFFSDRPKSIAWVKIDQFHTSAFERCDGFKVLILIRVGRMRILDVFNVAHSFTEFALGYVVCLTFAAWNVLNLVKFEINLLVTNFVTVGTLCGEVPVFFWREVNLS